MGPVPSTTTTAPIDNTPVGIPDIDDTKHMTKPQRTPVTNVTATGTAYVGDFAYKHTDASHWTETPMLKYSYITTSTLTRSQTPANNNKSSIGSDGNKSQRDSITTPGKEAHTPPINEIIQPQHAHLYAWIRGHDNTPQRVSSTTMATIPRTRILQSGKRMVTIDNLSFIIIPSSKARVIFGRDSL